MGKMTLGTNFREANVELKWALEKAVLERKLKDVKLGGSSSDRDEDSGGSSRGSSGRSSGSGGSLDARPSTNELAMRLAAEKANKDAEGRRQMDRDKLLFNQQRTLTSDRSEDELAAIRLRADLERRRKTDSINSALGSLNRFR